MSNRNRSITIYFDGSVEPTNPGGVIGYGWWGVTDEGHETENFGVAFKGGASATNNVAEYIALINSIIWCVDNWKSEDIGKVLFRGDSQLVINQMSGEWRARHANLKPVVAIANMLIDRLRQHYIVVEFEWIPRKQNKRADRLANKVIDDALDDRRPLTERLRKAGLLE